MSAKPVGIFDSGVGGLSILREIVELLPDEPLVYLADQAHVPYGKRQLSEVLHLSENITRFLLEQGAKLIVVACNTASAAALHPLRQLFPDTPFVGMEPAVKPAARITETKSVGVLATPATFQGKLFESVQSRFGRGVKLAQVTVPGLVERIEAGELESEATRELLEEALQPLLETGVDTIVLACTHYPFVIPLIRQIVGTGINVIDPSPAIAKQTRRLLEQHGLRNQSDREGDLRLLTTGDPKAMSTLAASVLSKQLPVQQAIWRKGALSIQD